MDALVSGVHFPSNFAPASLGYRSLAVNLSDMAAMGAKPRWLNLALTLPDPDDTAWIQDFHRGLAELADEHAIATGSTLTQPGALSVSIEIWGVVASGGALCRQGAKPGDDIYVTGTLGDAGLAIEGMKLDLPLNTRDRAWIERRYSHPTPRIGAGLALRGLANSAIDLSDGLVGDLGHILRASNLGATLQAEALPLSQANRNSLSKEHAWKLALSAGDDYELCFSASPKQRIRIEQAMAAISCPIHRIGIIEIEPGLRCQAPNGVPFDPGQAYQHFA